MKTVLITGGATGIGAECARIFANAGYLTLICYNKSKDLASELKSQALDNNLCVDTFCADITSGAQVEQMFDDIIKMYGKIDVLVNNAGIALIKEFTGITLSEWDDVLNVNLKGTFLCSQQAVKIMSKQNFGKIINVSSMWGLCGASFETAYSAAKAGIIGFTKALAKEVSPSGITVNAVAPGFIETGMNCNVPNSIKQQIKEDTPAGRLGTTGDVAKVIFYLANDAPDFITGEVINISGGLIT